MSSDNIEIALQAGLGAVLIGIGCYRLENRKRYFFAGLVALVLAGVHKIQSIVTSSPTYIAREISKNGPKFQNSDVRFDGAEAKGSRLFFNYTLLKVRSGQINHARWERDIVPKILASTPSDTYDTIERLNENGISVIAQFYDSLGIFVGDIPMHRPKRAPQPLVQSQPPAPIWRDFKNQAGVVIRARMVSFDGTNVTISREDGRAFTNPLGIYSDEDQAYIRTWKPGSD